MRIVGCFLEFEGKFVILLRHSHKPQGDTWGLPGGKVEPGESDQDAITRELVEETGYVAKPSELELLGTYGFTLPNDKAMSYVTHRIKLEEPHLVTLEESAHAEFKWVSAEECFARTDLIHDFHNLLKLVGYVK